MKKVRNMKFSKIKTAKKHGRYTEEQCRLICSILSTDIGILSCMSKTLLIELYRDLGVYFNKYRYPSLVNTKEFKMQKPVWWPNNICYGSAHVLRDTYRNSRRGYKQVLLRVIRHLLLFHSNYLVSPVQNCKLYAAKSILEQIKQGYCRHPKPRLNSDLCSGNNDTACKSKVLEENVHLNNKVSLPIVILNNSSVQKWQAQEKTVSVRVPYVKLENIDELIASNNNNSISKLSEVFETTPVPQDPALTKDDFLQTLQLYKRDRLPKATLYKRLRGSRHYNATVPLSSELGNKLLEQRNYSTIEEYRLNRLKRIENYLKEFNPSTGSVDYPVVYNNRVDNTHVYNFPKRQFSQSQIKIEKLLKFCKPVTVKLEPLSSNVLEQYMKKSLVINLNKNRLFYS